MGKIGRHILALIAVAGMPSIGLAAKPAGAVYQGVWTGSIGSLPVRVCFNEDENRTFGAYFYMSRLVPIPLMQDEKGTQLFSEGWPKDINLPRWDLPTVSGQSIQGTWKQGPKALPINLTRITVAGDDAPCASMAFQQPRLEGIQTVRSRATKDGVAYTKVTLDHRGHFPDISVETFQFDGRGPAIGRVNALLAKPLKKTTDDEGWFGCVTSAYSASPWGESYNGSLEPRLITSRWLSVNHHFDGFCGGAHPDASNVSIFIDRVSGAKLEPLDWFSTRAVHREDLGGEYGVYTTLKSDLIAVILKGWKPDDSECYEATKNEESWDVAVARGALIFSPNLPHVIAACGDEYKIPFARLQPWLTPAGRKIVATLPR